MRIDSSTVNMSAWRLYEAEAEETQTTITRQYNGDTLQRANESSSMAGISYYEVEGGAAIYTTSSAGVERRDEGQHCRKHQETDPIENKNAGKNEGFQIITAPQNDHWISNYMAQCPKSDEIEFLKQLLELLKSFREGRRGSGKAGRVNLPMNNIRTTTNAMQFSASAASVKYQQSMAMFNAGSASAAVQSSSSGGSGATTLWTRQVIQEGFISGQESMAFSSTGSVRTSDGRSIDFNVTIEMSRRFAAAYKITGEESVYTDPLVINMDTDNATLDDVTFYFDLNNDGTAEEISGLDQYSGFLALDKNGDGEINNGGELFGAMTGDGFKELAAYDEDGNGWIDENDAVFNNLSVWVKCGGADAQLLSLKEADVGAIFLGSQATNYTLANSEGEEGAMVRQTGVYLKESGGAGTVQHVDFKA